MSEVIEQFNEAFNRHDVEGMMALMTQDCVFENTYPAPDGTRYEGWAAVKSFWEAFFRGSPDAHLDFEEIIVFEDRCVQRWVYRWGDGHVRGVDVMRLRDGKIAEKLSYVKG
jgi:ketosteroid isomerase-like protein